MGQGWVRRPTGLGPAHWDRRVRPRPAGHDAYRPVGRRTQPMWAWPQLSIKREQYHGSTSTPLFYDRSTPLEIDHGSLRMCV